MTQEYTLLNKALITRGKGRLNTDVLTCHKCKATLKEGDLIHKQRIHFYCAFCWQRAYLDVEDET
jgi:protein-arginine kinase activator protein McsA